MVGNLLDNAIKYSPEGGPITIAAAVAGQDVEVTVRDQGIGIPAEHLSAVFDRFHRVPNPKVGQIRGTGLGLPICRAIVEAHGGRIWAEQPADGPGAVLRFTLPVAPADVQLDADTPPREPQRQRVASAGATGDSAER